MTVLISKVETLYQNFSKRLSTILVALSENILTLMDSLLSLGIAEKEDLVRFEDKIPGPMDFVVDSTEKKDILITRFLAMGRAGASRLNETQAIVSNFVLFQHYISFMVKVMKYIHPDILKVNANFKEKAQLPFSIVNQGIQKLHSFFSANANECNLYNCAVELYKLNQRNSPLMAALAVKYHSVLKAHLDEIRKEDDGDLERTSPLELEELKAKIQARYSKELNEMYKEILKLKEFNPSSIEARLIKEFLLDLVLTEDELAEEVYHRLQMKTEQELKHEEYHKQIYEICQSIGRYQGKLSDIYSYTIEVIKTIKNNEGLLLKVLRIIKEFLGKPIKGVYGKQNGKMSIINFKPSLNQLNETLKLLKKETHDISALSPITEMEILLNSVFDGVDLCLESIYHNLFEVDYKGFAPDQELRRDIIYAEEKVFNIEKEKFLLLYDNYLPFRKEAPTIGAVKTLE